MATVAMVRHASHALLGQVLAGRVADVGLNETGWAEAERLARVLAPEDLTHIHSSPRRRARETAGVLGRIFGLPVEIVAVLDEVDFGAWAGRSFDELNADPHWQTWNDERDGVRAPGGETMEEVLGRMRTHLRRYALDHPYGRAVMVSHAEPIRALLLDATAQSFGNWRSFDVPPCHVVRFTVRAHRDGDRLSAGGAAG